MPGFIAALGRLNNVLARGSLWLAGIGLVVMTVIVFMQVFTRYVLGFSLFWVEPVAILLMSCFIFLGSAVGVHERFHMGFDVLIHFLPAGAGRWLKLISDLAVFGFGIGMVVYGMQLVERTWGSRMPVVGISSGLSYLPLVVGGALIVLFTAELILRRLAGMPVETEEPDADDVLMTEV